MKKLFFLMLYMISFTTISAQDDYKNQWQQVKESYKKGERKSVLPTIKKIQKQAMKDKNIIEIIKTLKEELALGSYKDDEKNNDVSRFYSKLDSIESTLKGKDKSLFYFFKGQFVKQYVEPNQWEIKQRSNVNNQNLNEIESWSLLDFKTFLQNYYKELHEKSADLKSFEISSAKSILDLDDNTSPYFKTFYDWAIYSEIDFLKNSVLFQFEDVKANNVKIKSLFLDLIASNSDANAKLFFRKEMLDLDANVYGDINEVQPYEKLYNEAPNVDYKLNLAAFIAEKYIYYKEEKKAYDFIQEAKKNVPSSVFMPNLLEIENRITEKKLSVTLMKEVQEKKPIPFTVLYRNMENVSFNIYVLSKDDPKLLQSLGDNRKIEGLNKKLFRTIHYQLKNLNDFKEHSTILEIEALPKGLYLFEYPSEDKKGDYNFLFSVNESSIVLGQTNGKDDKNKLRLIYSETGKSKGNVVLNMSYFDGKKNVTGKVNVDKKGEFSLPEDFNGNYYQIILFEDPSTGDFNLVSNYEYAEKRYNDGAYDEDNLIQIFTDRGIYRPGQVVYYKAVTTERQNDKTKVLANRPQTVILKDANDNEVDAQKLTTNEFGSISGQFVLPTGKLTGNFSIKIVDDLDKNNIGSYYFKVEEYKRPQFEITFDPIEGEYKLGQKTILKGRVTSFSGVPLSDTELNFEVIKRDLRRNYFRYQPNHSSGYNSVIGTVSTDKDGQFSIEVDLKKEEDIKSGIQVFGFEVVATLTDSNGETQSARTNIVAASTSYYFTNKFIDNTFADEDVLAEIAVKNYSEKEVEKEYQLKLSKYDGDERLLVSTYSNINQTAPYYNKSEFVKRFPHLKFDKKEELFKNTKQKIFDKTYQEKSVNLGRLAPGNYELEWYKVEGKDTIKTVQNFSVFAKTGLQKDQKPFLNVVFPKDELKAKDKATFYVYSAVPDAQVEIIFQQDNDTESHEFKTLKNGVFVYHKVIPQNCKTFNIQFRIAALNDVQTKGRSFNVKSPDETLKINLVTFRDKMLPNQKEIWKAYISGKDKEKVNAEVLATMYDKSLDKFLKHSIDWDISSDRLFRFASFDHDARSASFYYYKSRKYQTIAFVHPPSFQWFGGGEIVYDSYVGESLTGKVSGVPMMREVAVTGAMGIKKKSSLNYADNASNEENEEVDKTDEVKVRENLNETAFFYPSLKTDNEGKVYFEFTSPEALTKWKLSLLAHTKDARGAVLEHDVVTQKEFAVTPNYPRFLREGDELVFKSKISSLVEKVISGSAQLHILDALTNQDITASFGSGIVPQNFTLDKKGNTMVAWKLNVPSGVSSVVLKVIAKAGQYSDGEQKAVAVLPNRILVTDVQPVFVKEGETKTIVLESLKNNKSKTIQNVSNTLELTTNPIWDVMFALPSLKDESQISADAVFNKWYADVVASEIFKANPKLKTVFEKYQSKGELKSNLDKNQELKQLLLEETPWVLDSQDEAKQMQQIARLFDANSMKQNTITNWNELVALQNEDGGFSWYKGYPSSYNVSIYILNQLGKITKWVGDDVKNFQSKTSSEFLKKLVNFVDAESEKIWSKKDKIEVSNNLIDYLYSRNYWTKSFPLTKSGEDLKKQFMTNAPKLALKDYTFFGLHRGALLYNDYGMSDLSTKLLTYLKETATNSKTQGTYWKSNLDGWGWYQSKTVNQAGAIEAFSTLEPKNNGWIEDLKIWLMTQKEVSSWSNSKSTAEVIYQILNSGKSWTTNEADKVDIKWGNRNIQPISDTPGYVKTSEKTDKIDKNLGSVTVVKSGAGLVQGGLYWQYFENLDQVKSTENYISLRKELYKKVKTVNGDELKKITDQNPLKIGDKVTVRIILNTDRGMEFVHLKDLRAAGFEPVDVLSGYVWKGNLAYYQSTKDASTNFYIQYLPKGQYVLEYDVLCNVEGRFSNGVATLQNYYAPQMNARTAGTTVEIK